TDDSGNNVETVISRTGELRIIEPKTGKVLAANNIIYGSTIFVKDGQEVKRGEKLCEWDPFNAVMVSDKTGFIRYDGLIEGVTFREERDDQTGFAEKIIIEARQKRVVPMVKIVDSDGDELKSFTIPVGAYLSVEDGQEIKAGQRIAKIPRRMQKLLDITGGLPRVTELFEARNPSNPAVVSEIDGVVNLSDKAKRGNREVTVEAKDGQIRKYLVPLAKHILVQNGDFVRACTPLSDGVIAPRDILAIRGPFAVQQYLVNGVQEVYRSQGININDKHIEVIVRQMMRRFEIQDPGDTTFLEGEPVERHEFLDANDALFDKKIIVDAGDSNKLKQGQLVSLRQVREENSFLKRNDRKQCEFRDAVPATSTPLLLGITKASLGTESWISAASFQETTKVLSTAAIAAKKDHLMGLKENVIVGKRIPAGSGLKQFQNVIVTTKSAYEANKARGILDDLDMDYQEEYVGDENEL
ncbi:MAG: DNA-directed RNA polymerase subunit beta', partial [Saprospiraceae bacterium]|nr:DNA-directed RNA polymerase subunit beta' [Saprospiraceae bacterium]